MGSVSLSIAVIGGGGWIGQRHCQHILQNPQTRLCAIVDPSENGQEVARRLDTVCYATIDELLRGPHKPDAAIIGTPNSTHVPVGIQLAKAGVHILTEKPIAPDCETARFLVEAAESSGVKLLVGHHRRFNPYMRTLKEIVHSGKLGQVVAVNGLWTTIKPQEYFEGANSWRSKKYSGGPLLGLFGSVLLTHRAINAIHDLDLMHFLFGPVTSVHAEKTQSQRSSSADAVEEGAAVILKFESGIVGTFLISDNVASPHSFEQGTGENPNFPKTGADVYRIFGSKGTISFPDMTLSTYDGTSPSWTNIIKSSQVPVDGADIPPFSIQLDHFVRVCLGHEEPVCTGNDGMRALAVCEAIHRALEEGGSARVEMDV